MDQPPLKFIALCTPSLGYVHVDWASALRGICWPLNTGFVNFFIQDSVGGEIAETRNAIVQQALSYSTPDRQISHLFWIDDDVIVTRLSLLKLHDHNRDIASGVYFSKADPSEPLIFPGKGCGTTPFVPDSLIESWGCGMGLCLVKTDVYRHMLKAGLPLDKYNRPEWYKTTGGESMTAGNGIIWCGGTEDLYFLDRARELGYNPLIDCSAAAFGWHWNKDTKKGYPLKQWEQFRNGKKIVWDTPQGPRSWGEPPPAEPVKRQSIISRATQRLFRRAKV